MERSMNRSFLAAASLVASSLTAQAHEGHGLPGVSHWHASDTLGWLAVAVIAAVALVWGRRK
jgi:hypothetical protein